MRQHIDEARLRPAFRGRARRGPKVCATPGCPHLTGAGSYCAEHERDRDQARGTTTQRGYGTQHQRTRAALLPAAIGTPCPRCGQPMLSHQALDLGHSTPLAQDPSSRGDRIEHAGCNRSAGAR